MDRSKNMPLWVFLAFSSINTRKGALILIWCSVIFSIYCIPWPLLFDVELIKTIFLIDDWSWISMMAPIVIWYWLSLKWVDKNSGWETSKPN